MKHILSLGAGVQSSTMALMFAQGELEPMPDFAIFADTQAEPESVYKWLDWLEIQLPYPLIRVTAGNVVENLLEVRISKKNGKPYMSQNIPAYTANGGQKQRQCTLNWKIRPITKYLQQFKKEGVESFLGISTDEAHRQKDSRTKWIKHKYPLIERRLSRSDCLRWMEINEYPTPPPIRLCVLSISFRQRMVTSKKRTTRRVSKSG